MRIFSYVFNYKAAPYAEIRAFAVHLLTASGSFLAFLGVVAASLAIVAVAYLPAAVILRPAHWPSARVVEATVGLAAICTGLAFLLFFRLIAEIGPARATLITFLNPAVAVALGIGFLHEELTAGTTLGFPVILLGCWLATRSGTLTPTVEPTSLPLVEPS